MSRSLPATAGSNCFPRSDPPRDLARRIIPCARLIRSRRPGRDQEAAVAQDHLGPRPTLAQGATRSDGLIQRLALQERARTAALRTRMRPMDVLQNGGHRTQATHRMNSGLSGCRPASTGNGPRPRRRAVGAAGASSARGAQPDLSRRLRSASSARPAASDGCVHHNRSGTSAPGSRGSSQPQAPRARTAPSVPLPLADLKGNVATHPLTSSQGARNQAW